MCNCNHGREERLINRQVTKGWQKKMSRKFKAPIWLLITLFFISNRIKKVRKLWLKVQEVKTSFEVNLILLFCWKIYSIVCTQRNSTIVTIIVKPNLTIDSHACTVPSSFFPKKSIAQAGNQTWDCNGQWIEDEVASLLYSHNFFANQYELY